MHRSVQLLSLQLFIYILVLKHPISVRCNLRRLVSHLNVNLHRTALSFSSLPLSGFFLCRIFVVVSSHGIYLDVIDVTLNVDATHHVLILLGNLDILLHLPSVLVHQLFQLIILLLMISLTLSNCLFLFLSFLSYHALEFFDLTLMCLDLRILLFNLLLEVRILNLSVTQSGLHSLQLDSYLLLLIRHFSILL